jgi:hypothetical protein
MVRTGTVILRSSAARLKFCSICASRVVSCAVDKAAPERLVERSFSLNAGTPVMDGVHMTHLESTRVIVVDVLAGLESDMSEHAKVARAAAKHGPEQVLVSVCLSSDTDLTDLLVGCDDSDGHDVVAKQTKRTPELAVPARLRVPTHIYMVALAVRHKPASSIGSG